MASTQPSLSNPPASHGLATRMLGLYAAAQGLPAGSFGLGTLPHLRLTVNDYPTWTYPETASDEDKLLLLEHTDDSAVTVLAQLVPLLVDL